MTTLEYQPQPKPPRIYLRSLAYFRADLPLILVSLVLIGISTTAALLQPFTLAILVDTVFKATPSNHWVHRLFLRIAPDEKLGQILTLAAFAVGLRFTQEGLSLVQRLINAKVGAQGQLRVRCDLFRKLQELSIGYHRSQPQGDAIYRLSWDTAGFATILTVLVNSVLVSSVTLVVMTGIMLSMNWKLTLITLSVAPLLMLTTKYFSKVLKQRWVEAKEIDTELTTVIQRSLAAIGLVQAFGREADEFARFHKTADTSVKVGLKQTAYDGVYWLLIGTIFGVGYAAIFGYGGWLVYRDQSILKLGEAGLSVGSLIIFLTYVNQVYGPLQAVSGSGASIQGGIAGVQRVFEVLDRDPGIQDSPGAIHLPKLPRVLELKDVGFSYRDTAPVLRGVSCTITPGEMVAFVGSSGVGKTTLLNLLPRFYDATSGALMLDGHDVRSIKVRDLRQHIALVLQESIILPTTVEENITYGRPSATEAQIHHAAELSGAATFISKLEHGYDTVISESGSNLSGGQRQRIAIARALLTEAPIMVLDEPTSALDPQHEQMITETLRSLKRQRTIILVSHRLSTVADCDQIFVMDEGKIVERGTHAELIAQRGLYFQMAKHQLKIEDEPVVA